MRVALMLGFPLTLVGCRLELVQPLALNPHARSLDFSQEALDVGLKMRNLNGFGASFQDFIPEIATALAGFGGIHRRILPPDFRGIGTSAAFCAPYQGIDLSPRVKVFLWRGESIDGKAAYFVLISADLVAVTADMTIALVKTLAARFPTLELGHHNVQLVASHTHSGPAGLSANPVWSAVACDAFLPSLFESWSVKVGDSLQNAFLDLSPLSAIEQRDGTLPGYNKSRMDGMEVDDKHSVVQFKAPSGESLGCLFIFAVHPTWWGQEQRTLSSDVSGYIERSLAREVGTENCAHLNGAVGNAEVAREAPGTDTLEGYAGSLVRAALDRASSPPVTLPQELSLGAVKVSLPKPQLNWKGCGAEFARWFVGLKALDSLPRQTKLAYVYLGTTLFVFFPGEPVFSVQRSFEREVIRRFPRIAQVKLLSTANDYLGYVVEAESYNKEHLESCSTLYGSALTGALIEALTGALVRDGFEPANPT